MILRFRGERGARLRSTLRWVSAGQIDAGFAAMSGFVAGLFAIRLLDPATLGGYTLLFAAFGVASQFPAQLVFSPGEVIALATPERQRTAHLRWSAPIGLAISSISCLMVIGGAWPIRSEVATDQLTILAFTATAFTLISPLQDHVRRMLHLSAKSERAALTSIVQFVLTIGGVFALQTLDPLLVPFGAPFLANVGSTVAGLALARPWAHPRRDRPAVRDLTSIGGYLLTIGLSTSGARYVGNTIVARIAGPAALGFVESARIIARPADVIATGLQAVINPKSMSAAAARDRLGAKRMRTMFVVSLSVIVSTYLVIASFPWSWSPLPGIAPTAYEVPWLVPAVLGSFYVGNLAVPYFAEMMGARLQKNLAEIEFAAQSIQVVLSFTAAVIGPFAVPLAHAISTGYKAVVYRARSEKHFASTDQAEPSISQDLDPPSPM